MWKSGFSLRDTVNFFTQSNVEKEKLVHRGILEKEQGKFVNKLYIHNPQPLWKTYRQELMLAVMSRM